MSSMTSIFLVDSQVSFGWREREIFIGGGMTGALSRRLSRVSKLDVPTVFGGDVKGFSLGSGNFCV